jgi:hypothetical protein
MILDEGTIIIHKFKIFVIILNLFNNNNNNNSWFLLGPNQVHTLNLHNYGCYKVVEVVIYYMLCIAWKASVKVSLEYVTTIFFFFFFFLYLEINVIYNLKSRLYIFI